MVEYYQAIPQHHQNTPSHHHHHPPPPPNSQGYYTPGCEYAQPEEEWDREQLLDPAWEQQQRKVTLNLFFFY